MTFPTPPSSTRWSHCAVHRTRTSRTLHGHRRAGAGASTDATSARITVVVVVASALVAARARRRRASRTLNPRAGSSSSSPSSSSSILSRVVARVVVVVVAVVMLVLVERARVRVSSQLRRVASRRIASSRLSLFSLFFYRAYHPPDGSLEITTVRETLVYARRARTVHTVQSAVTGTSHRRVVIGGGGVCGTERFGRPTARRDGGERRRR